MTDLEAYETMVKFSGGEKQMLMVKSMIHEIGVDKTADCMMQIYKEKGHQPTKEFMEWMKQALTYIQGTLDKTLN